MSVSTATRMRISEPYTAKEAATCTWLRPQRLAAYTAVSACAIRCCPHTPRLSDAATPMLQVSPIEAPKPSMRMSATRRQMRSAIGWAAAESAPYRMTTNSSPP